MSDKPIEKRTKSELLLMLESEKKSSEYYSNSRSDVIAKLRKSERECESAVKASKSAEQYRASAEERLKAIREIVAVVLKMHYDRRPAAEYEVNSDGPPVDGNAEANVRLLRHIYQTAELPAGCPF